MAYTVKQLANMSGVSVRTLHFYDEIGLLKPASVGGNRYRYYEEEQLLLLQQILFYRELDFSLEKIQKLLHGKSFDKIKALQAHRDVLQQNAERMKTLIQTIDKTLSRLKGDKVMSDEELYYGFTQEKQKEYEKFLVSRLGKQVQNLIDESNAKSKGWTKEDWKRTSQESEVIHRNLVGAIQKGLFSDSPEVQVLIREHYRWIQQFFHPTKEVYEGLGQLYTSHPDFRKLFDSFHPKLAEFLADAMKVFANNSLA